MATALLTAIVTADTAAASSQIGAFGAKLDALGSSGTSSLSRLQTAGKLAFAALGVGAIAFGVSAVKAFQESQKVMAQTEAVLKSTGQAAGLTANDVTNLAGTLSKLSGVDDEVIQSGENVLLTFTNIRNEAGKGNDIFNQTTAATLDLSVALGKDLPSAAILVGKALNDPIKGMTALTRAGVSFTQQQKDQIAAMVESGDVMGAQKIILAELNKEFGGSAKAAGDTFAGALGKLSTAFGNLQESIGGALIPVLQFMAGVLTTLVNAFNLIPGPIKTAMLAAVALGGVLVGLGLVANTVKSSMGTLGISMGGIASAAKGAVTGLTGLVGGFGALAGALSVGVTGIGAVVAAFLILRPLTSQMDVQVAKAKDTIAQFGVESTQGAAASQSLIHAYDGVRYGALYATKEIERIKPALDGQTTATKGAGDAAKTAAADVAALAAKNKELQAAADAAKLAELGLAGGFLGIAASAQQASQASDTLSAAQKTVNKLAKDGKKGTNEYAAAVDAEHQAALAATTSQLSLAQSVANYIQTQHGGQATQKQAIADIKGFGAAAGLTKGETDTLINSVLGLIGDYKNVPKKVSTTVSAPGVLTAISNAKALGDALYNIPKSVTSYVNTIFTTTGSSTVGGIGGHKPLAEGAVFPGYATGRRFVGRYGPFIAGEGSYGTPVGTGGEIVSNRGVLPLSNQVMDRLGEAIGRRVAPARGPTINVYVENAYGADDLNRKVVEALTKSIGGRMPL